MRRLLPTISMYLQPSFLEVTAIAIPNFLSRAAPHVFPPPENKRPNPTPSGQPHPHTPHTHTPPPHPTTHTHTFHHHPPNQPELVMWPVTVGLTGSSPPRVQPLLLLLLASLQTMHQYRKGFAGM